MLLIGSLSCPARPWTLPLALSLLLACHGKHAAAAALDVPEHAADLHDTNELPLDNKPSRFTLDMHPAFQVIYIYMYVYH